MQGTMSLDDIYHCRNHNVSGLYRHLPKLLDLLDSWGKLKGTQLVPTTTISKSDSATTKTATSIETTTTKPKWIKVKVGTKPTTAKRITPTAFTTKAIAITTTTRDRQTDRLDQWLSMMLREPKAMGHLGDYY